MKTYLLINQDGQGIGVIEIQGTSVKPGVSTEEAVELRKLPSETKEKVRKNPHYFYMKNGSLKEMTDTEKTVRDKKAKDLMQRFRKKP